MYFVLLILSATCKVQLYLQLLVMFQRLSLAKWKVLELLGLV